MTEILKHKKKILEKMFEMFEIFFIILCLSFNYIKKAFEHKIKLKLLCKFQILLLL